MRYLLPLCMLVLFLGHSACTRAYAPAQSTGWSSIEPETMQAKRETELAGRLQELLSDGSQVQVRFDRPPYFDSHEKYFNSWWWDQVAVTVDIFAAEAPPALAVLEEATEDRMREWMAISNGATVGVQLHDRPATDLPSNVVRATTSGGAQAQVYVVQEGDTLAQISSAFYGSPQHWRLIADANLLDDPSQLPTGLSIRIPALPDTAQQGR